MVKRLLAVTGVVAAVGVALAGAASVARASGPRMPELVGVTRWFNTPKPLARDDLHGRVVLVDFFTYSCINCIRTLPHVTQWDRRYRDAGLTIVGVHSPEFAFEKNPANVEAALKRFGIEYPVAMDNDHATWNAYQNRYWPAEYLVDRDGVVRYQHFGEGHYDEMEQHIRDLLCEGRPKLRLPPPTSVVTEMPRPMTPEIYLGSARLSNLGNGPPVAAGVDLTFAEPEKLDLDRFYLAGRWRFAPEQTTLASDQGKIILRFRANQANMVLADGAGASVEVLIDGQPATADNKGADVSLEGGKAICHVKAARLYGLARFASATAPAEHTLEIRIAARGLHAYTFTFG
jgi:thiol-disulfide isomerase/thioredoxin